MKLKYKIITRLMMVTLIWTTACQDVDMQDPNPSTGASSLSAQFLMVNASPDAPSLDMFINNLKLGTSILANSTQFVYTLSPLTSNGVVANTNIRAKASSGTIGGTLTGQDLIFRSSNNGTGNFTALDSGYYTLIVVDSIKRPKPLRTYNATNLADITYYSNVTEFTAPKIASNGDTTIALTTNNSIVVYNLVKKYNGGVKPSFLIPIGIVPLGSSDPGGIRFLVITDQLPLPSTTRLPKPVVGKCAIRFIHASPNTEDVTVTVGGASVSGLFGYPMTYPTFPTASVGSRSVTANFKTINSGTLDIEVMGAGSVKIAEQLGYTFDDKGVYTIVMSGDRTDVSGSNLLVLSIIKNK